MITAKEFSENKRAENKDYNDFQKEQKEFDLHYKLAEEKKKNETLTKTKENLLDSIKYYQKELAKKQEQIKFSPLELESNGKIKFDSPVLVSLPGISLKIEVEFVINNVAGSFTNYNIFAGGKFEILSIEKISCFTETQADLNVGRFIDLENT